MEFNYFAFGSNLSSRRLLQRLPLAEVHCVATLAGHRLCWRKNGRDQSGKCDIHQTGDNDDLVYGVVYRVSADDRLRLDEIETHGFGYQRREVAVRSLGGEHLDVFTYYALDINYTQQPYTWYKEHVLRGALEHGFPADYVEYIRATPSIEDRDEQRRRRELAIYPEPL
jgi:hypothetical protein